MNEIRIGRPPPMPWRRRLDRWAPYLITAVVVVVLLIASVL